MLMLFPRRNTGKPGHDALKAQAHRLLDLARSGVIQDVARIRWALKVTGDL
jgi:hypothetical protein